jgi:hypothetical protein
MTNGRKLVPKSLRIYISFLILLLTANLQGNFKNNTPRWTSQKRKSIRSPSPTRLNMNIRSKVIGMGGCEGARWGTKRIPGMANGVGKKIAQRFS